MAFQRPDCHSSRLTWACISGTFTVTLKLSLRRRKPPGSEVNRRNALFPPRGVGPRAARPGRKRRGPCCLLASCSYGQRIQRDHEDPEEPRLQERRTTCVQFIPCTQKGIFSSWAKSVMYAVADLELCQCCDPARISIRRPWPAGRVENAATTASASGSPCVRMSKFYRYACRSEPACPAWHGSSASQCSVPRPSDAFPARTLRRIASLSASVSLGGAASVRSHTPRSFARS